MTVACAYGLREIVGDGAAVLEGLVVVVEVHRLVRQALDVLQPRLRAPPANHAPRTTRSEVEEAEVRRSDFAHQKLWCCE